MNSPAHFRNPNPQVRFNMRPPPNFYVPSTPVMAHHTSMYTQPPPRNNIRTVQDFHINLEQSQKEKLNSRKNSDRSANEIQLKSTTETNQPRVSQTSTCSIKELAQQAKNQNFATLSNRIKSINDQLAFVFTRLTQHDGKIQQIQNNSDKNQQPEKQKLQLTEKMQDYIWKSITKQVNESQQHITLQNKLIRADIDTLKLQLMCFSDKKEVKSMELRMEETEKSISKLNKQIEKNIREETQKILQKRKKDIQRFEKEVQEIKSKMLDIALAEESKQIKERVCLFKSLSFKVIHQMHAYNEGQSKWIQMGTGQTIYGIDQEGYLLDHQNKYITDQKGNLIKLQPQHIQILKKNGLAK